MTTAKIDRALLRTLPALSVVAPIVIFGFIYVLAILPARQAASAAGAEAEASGAALARSRAQLRDATPASSPSAPRSFDVRTAADLVEAVTTVAASQSVGGVDQLSVQVHGAAVTASFDARYAQLDEFFSSLDGIAGTYDITYVDIVQKRNSPLMRATVEFLVRGQAVTAPDVPVVADASLELEKRGRPGKRSTAPFSAAPEKGAVLLFPPAPVVRTILFSSQQKSAVVDGRIVRPGDRVGTSTVQSIEADTVVLVSDSGLVKRLALESSGTHATKR